MFHTRNITNGSLQPLMSVCFNTNLYSRSTIPFSYTIHVSYYMYTPQKMMKKKTHREEKKIILYCKSFNIWLREISTENILLRMFIVRKSLQISTHSRIGTEQIQNEMSSANSFAHNNQSKLIESIFDLDKNCTLNGIFFYLNQNKRWTVTI